MPELYLHGLALGDFEVALQGLLGEDAPLSGATVARLKEKWQGGVGGVAEPAARRRGSRVSVGGSHLCESGA